jgi:hypothetical protein
MTYHDDKTPNAEKRTGSERPRTDLAGWGVPLGIAAIVFVAATMIFSSAGGNRTRTANNQPSAVTSPGPTTSESVPAQAPTPARPNASFTQ